MSYILQVFLLNILKEYENSVFINDNDTQKLLNNNINYASAIDLITEDSPINLKWLKEMVKILYTFQYPSNIELNTDFSTVTKQVRNDKKLKFPIEKVILVEGITEEILLPVFARKLGYDFYANGVQVIPAGGKNQVVKSKNNRWKLGCFNTGIISTITVSVIKTIVFN